MGSTRAARRAGTIVAAAATTARTIGASANVSGSCAVTSKTSVPMIRDSASALDGMDGLANRRHRDRARGVDPHFVERVGPVCRQPAVIEDGRGLVVHTVLAYIAHDADDRARISLDHTMSDRIVVREEA